jgi:spermidine/putrescine transport system permease protein
MKKSYAGLIPGLLWLLVFLIVPLIFVVKTSFLSRDLYGTIIEDWNVGNYTRFLDPLYLGIFWDTIKLSLLTTILCLLVSYPLAYAITLSRPERQKIWLVLVMVPFWVNFLIRAYAWILLLRSQGVVNTLLTGIGVIDQPLSLLYTPGSVLVGMVYTLIPFMVLPVYVALEKMDHSLHEAAADLGATPLRSFWHITVPQTIAGIAAGCILVFVSSMGMFVVPDVLGGAKSAMYSNVIQNQFLSARDWPFGSALSVLFIVFSLLLIYMYRKAMTSRRTVRSALRS